MHRPERGQSLAFGKPAAGRGEALEQIDQRGRECANLGRAGGAELRAKLGEVRARPDSLERKPASELIIQLAPYLEDFVGELFGISKDLDALRSRHNALAPLNALKRKFVQKKAISGVKEEQANALNGMALEAELESLFGEAVTEASYLEHVT